jgi:zinc transport system substrate-binding protein
MKKIVIFILFLVISTTVILKLGKRKSDQRSSKPQSVLVSIPVYSYFVERIAGDTVTVRPLVPATSNPHTFEPSPKEMQAAFASSAWVRIGESFEEKLLTIFKEKNEHFVDLDLSKTLATALINSSCSHCHHHDEYDLHYWLSPKLAKRQAIAIATYLSQTFPKNQKIYEQNLALFLADLDKLDREITELLKPLKNKSILVSHAAFAYFCRDYNLEQLSIEIEGKDPHPKEITRTLMRCMQSDIKTIITQPQYSNKGAELIAQRLNLPLHSIDPYDGDYFKNLKTLAEIIAKTSES